MLMDYYTTILNDIHLMTLITAQYIVQKPRALVRILYEIVVMN